MRFDKGKNNRSAAAAFRPESLEPRVLLSNSTPGTATDLPDFYGEANYNTTGTVTASVKDSYYRFYTLYGNAHLHVNLDALSADADLYVLNNGQQVLAQSRLGGTQSETIDVDIPGHQYIYIDVKEFAGNDNFSLFVYNDYAGSTLNTARDIGTSWGQTSDDFMAYDKIFWNDYLDYRDTVDIVKFRMEASGTISLRELPVSNTNALVNSMQLLNSSGSVIATAATQSDGSKNLDRFTAPAGTYYVKFAQSSGSGAYQFRITSDYAGDTTATARNLGDITNTSREDVDMVGQPFLPTYEDATDLYKFTLSQTAPVNISLTIPPSFSQPTFDANLELAKDTNNDGFIESNEVIKSSSVEGNDAISTTLGAGTYYVVATQNGAYTTYTLDIDSDLDSVAGDPKAYQNMSKAVPISPFNGESYREGGFGIAPGDITDFYKFTMTSAGTFLASAQDNPVFSRTTSVPALGIIKDSNNNQRADAGEVVGSFSSTGTLQINLPAGTYYLEASGNGIQTDYSLRTVADYAGNTLNTARAMAAISGSAPATQTFQDYIEENFGSTSDYNDFYKFVLPATYTTTLKTTGVAGEDLSLALIKDQNGNGVIDSGDILTTSDVANSPFENIQQVLPAGTYFVRVLGTNGGTNYTLSANFVAGGTVVNDPDGTIAKVDALAANHKTLGQTFASTLSPANDVDLVRITVAAGQKASFDVDSRNGSNLDTYIRLFNSAGTQLAANNDGAAPGEAAGKFSYLEYTFTTAGNYYVGVSLNPNSAYSPTSDAGVVNGGTTGDYTLALNSLGTTTAPTVLRVNSGGTAFTDANGNFFEGDTGFSGGGVSNTAFAVAGTTDDSLYYTYRHGTSINFNRNVVNGTYKLSLYFVDSTSTAAGQRTFDVTAQGTKILSKFDIFAAAGAAKTAVVKTFTVTVSNGKISISLAGVVGSANISAVSLVKQ